MSNIINTNFQPSYVYNIPPPLHPQTNGQTKRMSRIIQDLFHCLHKPDSRWLGFNVTHGWISYNNQWHTSICPIHFFRNNFQHLQTLVYGRVGRCDIHVARDLVCWLLGFIRGQETFINHSAKAKPLIYRQTQNRSLFWGGVSSTLEHFEY